MSHDTAKLPAKWSGNAMVRAVVEDDNLKAVYTTVMTIFERLHKKHLLDRVLEGRAFRHKPRFTQEEMKRTLAKQLMRQLLGSGEAAKLSLSYFVEAVTAHDA